MAKFIAIVVLIVALLFTGAYAVGLFDDPIRPKLPDLVQNEQVTPPDKLGEDLYKAEAYLPIPQMKRKTDAPIVLHGVMTAFETEEVPSEIPQGRVLFIGEQVDDAAMLAAGSA